MATATDIASAINQVKLGMDYDGTGGRNWTLGGIALLVSQLPAFHFEEVSGGDGLMPEISQQNIVDALAAINAAYNAVYALRLGDRDPNSLVFD